MFGKPPITQKCIEKKATRISEDDDPDYIQLVDYSETDSDSDTYVQEPEIQETDVQEPDSSHIDSVISIVLKASADDARLLSNAAVVQHSDSDDEADESPKGRRRRQKGVTLQARRKLMKNSGEPYINCKKSAIRGRRFTHAECKCPFECRQVPEDTRRQLFQNFWSMDYAGQQSFLLKHSQSVPVVQHRVSAPGSDNRKRKAPEGKQRKGSTSHHFTVDTARVRVCQKVFLTTLDIGQKRIRLLLAKPKAKEGVTPEDMRGKHRCAFRYSDATMERVRQFFNQLPSKCSHYRKADTNRRYLQPGLSLPLLYKEYCKLNPDQQVQYQKFYTVWSEEFNYSFNTPTTDQCDQCQAFAVAQGEELAAMQNQHHAHLQRWQQSVASKRADTENARADSRFVVATFDMQKVLITPCTPVSNMHYKRKLSTYNFTIRDSGTSHVTCFVWNESKGRKGSAETATALYMWLLSLPKDTTRVVLYSDTAAGQNRNQAVAAMFLHFLRTAQTDISSITHKVNAYGH